MRNLVALAVATSALMVGQAQAALQHGFEVGGRVGYAWQNNTDLNFAGAFPANPNQQLYYTKSLHDNGAVGGLFVGYNWVCNDLLLGLDASADWLDSGDRHDFLTIDNQNQTFLNSARYKRDALYGVSARMGYRALDFMTPFVRLGIERVNNKLAQDVDLLAPPAAPARQLGLAESTHKSGYLVGLGADIPVFNKHTNVRIEYQYHWQNRVNFDFNNVNINGSVDVNPKAHFLTIGLVWSQV